MTSADSASTLKAYDAILEIASLREQVPPLPRVQPGPGKVDLREGEILTGIRIPKEAGATPRLLHQVRHEEGDGYRHPRFAR